jgi:hypothetical protein
MNLSKMQVKLSDHAYNQYCKRVGLIAYANLLEHLKMQIATRSFYRSCEYLQIEGIWWCYDVKENDLVFVTCYGQSDYDLPRARAWARKNKDRIQVSNFQALGIPELRSGAP